MACMSAAVAVLVATVIGGEPATPKVILGSLGGGAESGVKQDFACLGFQTCPPVIFVDANGDPAGCGHHTTGCAGRCRFCPGSTETVTVCHYFEGLECHEQDVLANCGPRYTGSCSLLVIIPPGSSGCGCNNDPAMGVLENDDCGIKQCDS